MAAKVQDIKLMLRAKVWLRAFIREKEYRNFADGMKVAIKAIGDDNFNPGLYAEKGSTLFELLELPRKVKFFGENDDFIAESDKWCHQHIKVNKETEETTVLWKDYNTNYFSLTTEFHSAASAIVVLERIMGYHFKHVLVYEPVTYAD